MLLRFSATQAGVTSVVVAIALDRTYERFELCTRALFARATRVSVRAAEVNGFRHDNERARITAVSPQRTRAVMADDAPRRRGGSRLFGDDDDDDNDDGNDGVGQERRVDVDVDADDTVNAMDEEDVNDYGPARDDGNEGDDDATRLGSSSSTTTHGTLGRHASTESLSSALERVRFSASLRQLYRLDKDGGEYSAVGAAGLAILDTPGAGSRDILVYDPDKRPLVRRTIDSRLSFEPQRDNYVTVRHDDSILWSALMRDEGDWIALAAQVTIAQHISRCKRDGFHDGVMVIDLAKSSSTAPTLHDGDAAQISYEAVRGGIPGDTAADDDACTMDYLNLQLFDGATERVHGRKVKIATDDASSVDVSAPRAVLQGLIGAGKDSRRLILAPQTQSSFVLYDVTVARTKKGTKESVAKPKAAFNADELSERVKGLVGLSGAPISRDVSTTAPRTVDAPNNIASPQTPPAPWWPPPQSMAYPSSNDVILTDLRRAISSLSEDVAFITQRARTGGVWVPPTLDGELKHAVLELNKVRLRAMLPKLDAETLSLGDVKQLAAEAVRVEQFQEEIRELRDNMKRLRTELHDALECTSRAEEERDAFESQVALLKRQSEQDRERIEIQKRRADVSSATSAAAAVEAVLVAEDKSFDTDVAEVTALMRAENEKLLSKLENPGWIDEHDALREERDALARRVAELERDRGHDVE